MSKDLASPSEAEVPEQRQPIPPEFQQWMKRLAAVQIKISDVVFEQLIPWGSRSFDTNEPELNQQWQQLKARLNQQQPIALARHKQQLLWGCILNESASQPSYFACMIAEPFDERAVQIVQLSLGWLQTSMAIRAADQGRRSSQLLEIIGYTLSQQDVRTAAQEWINRTLKWLREQSDQPLPIALTLLKHHKGSSTWWVSSDQTWVEKGSAPLQHALELASRAVVELKEIQQGGWWALPLVDQGEVYSILVLHQPDVMQLELNEHAFDMLRSSASLVEPILRRWYVAEQSWWSDSVDASKRLRQRLFGTGYYTWKFTTVVTLVVIAIITLLPVNQYVTADVVVEGDARWVVSAPTQGFLSEVLVRPGEPVNKGDTLVRFDDRDLRIEHQQYQSEVQQASDRLRQAMAENDAATSGLALLELKQSEARLALVQAKLSRLNITAPMTGVVMSGDWMQQVGAPIENGKQLFEIAKAAGSRLALQIPDQDIDEIRLNQQGKFRLTSLPDQTFTLQIKQITPVANTDSGKNTFRVEAQPLTNITLSPGMQGSAKVIVGETNLITRWSKSLVDWLRIKFWTLF